jgi:heme-degrading monooxygenase HmoA
VIADRAAIFSVPCSKVAGSGKNQPIDHAKGAVSMITEVADIRVRPEDRDAFGKAIVHGVSTVLSLSPGYRSHQIMACLETPGRVLLVVQWESLEAHTVGFRESPAFAQWRAIVGPFFVQPPQIEHFVQLGEGARAV